MEQKQVNADVIINWVKEKIESKQTPSRDDWIEISFRLVFLRLDEAQLYNKMHQAVSQKKLEILKGQTKKNVAAAELEVETTDEYKFMKDQEAKLYTIDESVRVAKKAGDLQL